MSKQKSLEVLDRFIISNNDLLNEGNILVVRVSDGYIYIERKSCEKSKEKRTSVYFSEFDGVLNIPFKELIHEDIRR